MGTTKENLSVSEKLARYVKEHGFRFDTEKSTVYFIENRHGDCSIMCQLEYDMKMPNGKKLDGRLFHSGIYFRDAGRIGHAAAEIAAEGALFSGVPFEFIAFDGKLLDGVRLSRKTEAEIRGIYGQNLDEIYLRLNGQQMTTGDIRK